MFQALQDRRSYSQVRSVNLTTVDGHEFTSLTSGSMWIYGPLGGGCLDLHATDSEGLPATSIQSRTFTFILEGKAGKHKILFDRAGTRNCLSQEELLLLPFIGGYRDEDPQLVERPGGGSPEPLSPIHQIMDHAAHRYYEQELEQDEKRHRRECS